MPRIEENTSPLRLVVSEETTLDEREQTRPGFNRVSKIESAALRLWSAVNRLRSVTLFGKETREKTQHLLSECEKALR